MWLNDYNETIMMERRALAHIRISIDLSVEFISFPLWRSTRSSSDVDVEKESKYFIQKVDFRIIVYTQHCWYVTPLPYFFRATQLIFLWKILYLIFKTNTLSYTKLLLNQKRYGSIGLRFALTVKQVFKQVKLKCETDMFRFS